MVVSSPVLVVGVAAGYHDDVTVSVGYRLEKAQRMAVLGRDTYHLNGVPDVERIRSGLTDLFPGERRGGAEREHPLSFRGIRILDHDRHRPVGVYKLYGCHRPRQLLFR